MRIFFTTLLVFESFLAIASAALHNFMFLGIDLVGVISCLIILAALSQKNKKR